jgi:hypothetical protein
MRFDNVHHAFNVAAGSVEFSVAQQDKATLQVGETIYIPKNTSFAINIKSRYAQIYVFVSGGGLVDLLHKAGKPYAQTIAPEKPDSWERKDLEVLQQEVGFQLS